VNDSNKREKGASKKESYNNTLVQKNM